MKRHRPLIYAIAGLLGVVSIACTSDPPTAPAPTVTSPAPEPPPPPPPVPQSAIAGEYDLHVRLSASCAASNVASFFHDSPAGRTLTYSATIVGPDTALVQVRGEDVGEPGWFFGDSFGIGLDGKRITVLSRHEHAPEIMQEISPGEWLMFFVSGGTGEVLGDRIEARWQGRVSLVATTILIAWNVLSECDADDHALLFYPREREP